LIRRKETHEESPAVGRKGMTIRPRNKRHNTAIREKGGKEIKVRKEWA
jgi:hypothetical protein